MKLLEKDPKKRINADDALKHSWIVEKVKIKSIVNKTNLYPSITIEDKHKFEEVLDQLKQSTDNKYIHKSYMKATKK